MSLTNYYIVSVSDCNPLRYYTLWSVLIPPPTDVTCLSIFNIAQNSIHQHGTSTIKNEYCMMNVPYFTFYCHFYHLMHIMHCLGTVTKFYDK